MKKKYLTRKVTEFCYELFFFLIMINRCNKTDCVILPHSAKSDTIGVLTSLGIFPISPDFNIQIR